MTAGKNIYLYILVMAGVTYLIRMLPLVLSRREIKSPLIRSFLYYVPYACLAAMTFPAILSAPQTEGMNSTAATAAGAVGFIAALAAAYRNLSLVKVAVIACLAVFITEQGLLLFI